MVYFFQGFDQLEIVGLRRQLGILCQYIHKVIQDLLSIFPLFRFLRQQIPPVNGAMISSTYDLIEEVLRQAIENVHRLQHLKWV